MLIKEQNFGVEIEMTGITREQAAQVIAQYYETSSRFGGTYYRAYYVQFCLAMSAWAIECPNDRLFFKSSAGYTRAQKYTLMNNVLVHRLGLSGKEFKTCRYHLLKAFSPVESTAA